MFMCLFLPEMITSVQRTLSTLAGHSAIACGMNVTRMNAKRATTNTRSMRTNFCVLEGDMTANDIAAFCPSKLKDLLMPLFLMGCFPVDFQEGKRPLRTKSVKRPIKVGKRPINEGKRPIKAKVLVGVSIGCLMGCFRAPPPWRKTAPLKRPIKRSMISLQALSPSFCLLLKVVYALACPGLLAFCGLAGYDGCLADSGAAATRRRHGATHPKSHLLPLTRLSLLKEQA